MEKEDLRKKVLSEYEKGNICYRGFDGLYTMPIKDFVKQPLHGMLYDINRNRATILTFLDDPKWTNDFALTVLLEYYYDCCDELRKRVEDLEAKLKK